MGNDRGNGRVRGVGAGCAAAVLLAGGARGQWVEPEVETLLHAVSPTVQDAFAWQVRAIGDVTGDGTVDFATCAPLSQQGAPAGGKVMVLSGASGAAVWTRLGLATSGILGYALEVVDWNGDGVLDVLASAPFEGPGWVHAFSGLDGTTLASFTHGSSDGDGYGASLALGGDFDGDGHADVAIGSTGYDSTTTANVGRVYVVRVGTTSLVATIDAPALAAGDEEFGIGLAFVGDAMPPLDGRDDLVAGHRDIGFWTGLAIGFRHDGTAAQRTFSAPIAMDFGLSGNRFDGGLDTDGDGIGDFLVGAPPASTATVFSGGDGAVLRTYAGNLDEFGTGELVPDVDGDGCADVLLGARGNDLGAANGGRVVLHSGRGGQVLRTMTHTLATRRIGRDARAIGDVDGDGVVDFVLAGTGGGTSGPPGGSFLVVRGRPFVGSYCTAKTTSGGCVPAVVASGAPSLSAAGGFAVDVLGLEPQRPGLVFFGASEAESPFQGGWMCVAAPKVRMPAASTGGAGPCTGMLSTTLADMVARAPAGLIAAPGAVRLQAWTRDPGGIGQSSLSDALRVQIVP